MLSKNDEDTNVQVSKPYDYERDVRETMARHSCPYNLLFIPHLLSACQGKERKKSD